MARWRVYMEPDQYWYAQQYGQKTRIVGATASQLYWAIERMESGIPGVVYFDEYGNGGRVLVLPPTHCPKCQRACHWDVSLPLTMDGVPVSGALAHACVHCGYIEMRGGEELSFLRDPAPKYSIVTLPDFDEPFTIPDEPTA